MSDMIDLGPAVDRITTLVSSLDASQLDLQTPCPEWTLGDLLDHVGGLSLAFAAAAAKSDGDVTAQGPSADANLLGSDWQARVPSELSALAVAWREPDAWTGMTRAGGVELPGEVAGLVALNELVVHGWDIAQSSGQRFQSDPDTLEACHKFVAGFASGDEQADASGLFGRPVEVPDDAPTLDQLIALSGRDPSWPEVKR